MTTEEINSILRGDEVSFKAEGQSILHKAREYVERRLEERVRKENSREDSERVKNQGEGGGESVIEKEFFLKKGH